MLGARPCLDEACGLTRATKLGSIGRIEATSGAPAASPAFGRGHFPADLGVRRAGTARERPMAPSEAPKVGGIVAIGASFVAFAICEIAAFASVTCSIAATSSRRPARGRQPCGGANGASRKRSDGRRASRSAERRRSFALHCNLALFDFVFSIAKRKLPWRRHERILLMKSHR